MKNYYRYSYALKVLICFSFLLFFSITIWAQNKPYLVTGIVQDKSEPLAGVNVILKNKNKGTITAFDGTFAINMIATDTLVFTFLGYKHQEVPFKGETELRIIMVPSPTSLDQVVINAGYYKVTEKEKTGSISRIGSKEIEDQILMNPIASLKGRMTGVKVTQGSAIPGSGFEVTVRGKSSILAGNRPLYVIDGVPFSSESLSARDVSGASIPLGDFSPFSFLNPADIELSLIHI